MPKGRLSEVGQTMINKNGYHNTKTANGWRLTHQLVAEEMLGRPLQPNEMVRFKDGDRTNLEPDNIEVIIKKVASTRRRLAVVERQIQDLMEERKELLSLLQVQT